jgi:hypothetical protein
MNNKQTTTERILSGLKLRTVLAAASVCFVVSWPSVASADTDTAPAAITPDGGRYYGPLIEGRRHGKGKIEWDNGARYEGGFENGLFFGPGKYQSSSGFIYEGDFKNGTMSGHGRYVMPDGSVYVGEFRNDNFNGRGRYEMPTGYVYEGMFSNGFFEGKGKLAGKGEEYQGEFRKGQYWGQGELKYEDGRKYKGEFVQNHYQGKGRFESRDGQVYEGEFDKGELTGSGSYKRPDGSRYVGGFLKWKPHGPGSFTDSRGNVYEGSFVDGELVGTGRMIGKDGSRYEGEFKKWQFHGQGVYRYANGDEYKGAFASGLFEGEGAYTYASPQKDGRTKDSGTWRYGSLENKEAEKQTLANVETALYNQRALLDKTLAALAPHERDAINLYLLAIAGDGSQEVFRREVEFVRKQFDQDFNTQGRSVTLVNSRNTVTEYPMATLTSIRESLKGIAGRMDKDKDILFLFLTSHGSKKHELTLDQNGINLRNLEARELGALLKETGIRWKVIVVSACYAGGFIDPLKDDHTMVITASRHDRRSLGCADENDFTYFGRAFFKESLPGSRSFDEAFNKARSLVAKWEATDFKSKSEEVKEDSHSEPQIHSSPLIRQYLQRWQAHLKAAQKKSGSAKNPGDAPPDSLPRKDMPQAAR